MTDWSPTERLAALPSLSRIPRAQLEWLAAHGEIRRFEAGEIVVSKERWLAGLFILLSGSASTRVDRGGTSRVVRLLQPGTVTGHLPYSRMVTPAAAIVAEELVEILLIADADVREMTRECFDFTALCVHEMIDRARVFKSDDLQQEKLASLGRLSAGLAHELNNPSSAAARSAREMDACRLELVAASRALGAAGLRGEQAAAVEALETAAGARPAGPYSPLAQADREDALGQWLAGRGIDQTLAASLADTSITTSDLDTAAAALAETQLPIALRYVAAAATATRLTAEIRNAAGRIHALVAAVKTHTHMDQAPVVEAVSLEGNLRDTLTLVAGKARAKAVTLALEVESGLPAVHGVVAELNQVWLNLVDNALDAVPPGGHVTVTARRDETSVVVRVIDDGAGVPDGDRARIFEPFFTTKPPGQGTGLGLDIVQAITRSHRGAVDVQSRPGHTEFRVSLPLAGPSC
jgi:signal transduction histidine kinase